MSTGDFGNRLNEILSPVCLPIPPSGRRIKSIACGVRVFNRFGLFYQRGQAGNGFHVLGLLTRRHDFCRVVPSYSGSRAVIHARCGHAFIASECKPARGARVMGLRNRPDDFAFVVRYPQCGTYRQQAQPDPCVSIAIKHC